MHWILGVLAGIAAYELVRALLVRWVSKRFRRSALEYVRQHRLRLDSARFLSRVWIRQSLLMDPEIEAAMMEAARVRRTSIQVVRLQVEEYLDEMVPAFSVAAYYRFGAALARFAVELAYEVVFDPRGYETAMAKLPPGAVPVFVINHRSNADFVVLSYGLLRHVALSYAVGEWALVWPLDVLFRAFGSYFVRRGEKDPLYHKVLERYVQVLVGEGGVTGFFIEGKLSRDGRLGAPKAGLLDYIVGLKRTRPDAVLAFVPVGLNFDRVLEDASLLEMGSGPPSLAEKLASFAHVVLRLPRFLIALGLRVATKSHRDKYGYAAVQIGEPVLLDDLVEQPIWSLPKEERRPLVDALAQDLMTRIGRVVPATPVPLFATAMLAEGDRSESAVTQRVRDAIVSLRALGVPVLFGRAFPRPSETTSSIQALDSELDVHGEAELVVLLAGYALERRGIVSHHAGVFAILEDGEEILRYYANSIVHHLGS